jgi:hypothetical protein
MKSYMFAFIPFALLMGLLVGGWGPRSELQTLRDELNQTKRMLKDAKKKNPGSDVGQVTRLLGIDGVRRSQEAGVRDQGSGISEQEVDDGETKSMPDNQRLTTNVQEEEGEEIASDEDEESEKDDREALMNSQIDDAVELWKMRSEIARNTFISNARLSPQDATEFDVLVDAMNIRLEDSIGKWAKGVKEKEDASAEDGIRLVNDVTDTLVLTYEEMDRKLPETWRKNAGKGVQLTDFIDPSVAKPLIPVGEKMDDMGPSFGN